MWQAVGALAVIAGILFSAGSVGYKMANGKWQPVYYKLAEQMTKLQTDLNLKNAVAEGEAETLGKELTIVGIESELDHVKMQREVDRRVDEYITTLVSTGVWTAGTEGGESGSSGESSPMSHSAKSSYDRGGKNGLFADLDEFERAALKKIIHKAESAETLNGTYRGYLEKQEEKMEVLRDKYNSIAEQ